MISQIKQKGFTIVELLIVIVVIGILAAISIVAYNNVTQKARDDQRISDVRNIVNATASYHAEEGQWIAPANIQTALGGYDTVGVSADALSKVATTPPSSSSDVYQVTACGPSPQTGISVVYYSEADGAVSDPVTAGSC